MNDERVPEPEPTGALVPPPVPPSTALAAPESLPPRRWAEDDDLVEARRLIRRAVDRALNALDTAGDSIAEAVGLR
jgi:hypothetical protein